MDMAAAGAQPRTLADFKDYLLDCGAAVVGVADLTALPAERRCGFPRAVSIGMALPPDPILHLRRRRQRPADSERPIQAALAELARIALQYLAALGHRAEVLTPAPGTPALTHDEVAVLAGVAWIGKSSRPVNWDFGSAVRLTTVLTDADLAADKPVDTSFCGTCLVCTQACIAHAPSGNLWHRGEPLKDFFNQDACNERREKLAALGLDCRVCMSVCPYTTVYMLHSGIDVPNDDESPT